MPDDGTVLDQLRLIHAPPPEVSTAGARKLFRRLCDEGYVLVEGDHEYLEPHGGRRGAGEMLYRGEGFGAAQ